VARWVMRAVENNHLAPSALSLQDALELGPCFSIK
jgi:hypothetical protein